MQNVNGDKQIPSPQRKWYNAISHTEVVFQRQTAETWFQASFAYSFVHLFFCSFSSSYIFTLIVVHYIQLLLDFFLIHQYLPKPLDILHYVHWVSWLASRVMDLFVCSLFHYLDFKNKKKKNHTKPFLTPPIHKKHLKRTDRPTDKAFCRVVCPLSKQGRIHGYPSRVRVGRGHIWGYLIIWAGAVRPKTAKKK